MENDKVIIKKKKFSIIKFFVIILFLYIIGCLIFSYLTSPIKNIFIFNNKILSDQEIIDAADIRDYPSFFLTSKHSISSSLLKNPLIKKVTVSKKLFNKEVDITVSENKPLFYDKSINETVLENGDKISTKFDVPTLINSVPEGIYDKFITRVDALSDDTLLKMSEIEYKPNDIDKERFLVTMTDGNYVYLTLYKFEGIDKYNEILPSLEGKRGILYLDSGNYFEILN